jgi:hypothetical protein
MEGAGGGGNMGSSPIVNVIMLIAYMRNLCGSKGGGRTAKKGPTVNKKLSAEADTVESRVEKVLKLLQDKRQGDVVTEYDIEKIKNNPD